MTTPSDPVVVPVQVPTVAGVIPLAEILRGLERTATERRAAATDDDAFERVRLLAGRLATELELLSVDGGEPR